MTPDERAVLERSRPSGSSDSASSSVAARAARRRSTSSTARPRGGRSLLGDDDARGGALARRRRARARGRTPAAPGRGGCAPRARAAPGAGHRRDVAELGHLEHVLDGQRVALGCRPAPARGRRRVTLGTACRSPSRRSPSALERALELADELLDAARRWRRAAPARRRAARPLRGSGRSPRRPARRPTSAAGWRGSTPRASTAVERHQLADLARLPRALLGRHDRRVRLVLDARR